MNTVYFDILQRYAFGGIVTEQEKQELITWLKNNRSLLAYMEMQIMNMPETLDQPTINRNLQEIYQKIGYKSSQWSILYRTIKPLRRIVAFWILPLMAALTIFYVYTRQFDPQSITLSVNKGEKVQILLPDSSKVWMNAATKINYTTAYNIGDRNIELSGEAFFEVKHNPQLPFRVKTKNMNVEVLGTSFVMRDYDQDMTSYTVLKNGSLRIVTPQGQTLLKPNQKIEYNRLIKQYTLQNNIEAQDYIAWIDNILRFDGESFDQIVKTMERIYNVSIVINTETLKNHRFTGTVPNNGIESILKCIALSVPIKWEKKGEMWYIEKSR